MVTHLSFVQLLIIQPMYKGELIKSVDILYLVRSLNQQDSNFLKQYNWASNNPYIIFSDKQELLHLSHFGHDNNYHTHLHNRIHHCI